MRVTGEGITETIISGLSLIRRTRAQAMRLRGKVRLTVDLDESRERRRR
jgi:hypothetical protein